MVPSHNNLILVREAIDVEVTLKKKTVGVVPRGAEAQASGIGKRPVKIAEGVLATIRLREGKNVH
jgi:hypothetical protein